jgi:tetratricopeptide (TPR) repeat protein
MFSGRALPTNGCALLDGRVLHMQITREDGAFVCSGPGRHAWGSADDAERCCNGYRRVATYETLANGVVHVVFSWQVEDTHSPRPVVTDTPPPQRVDPNQPVRHLAFFRDASEFREGSTEYATLTAALLVLRLLDRWVTRASMGREVQFQEFIAVKRTVELLEEGPYQRVLGELVNTISAFAYGTSDNRIPKLIVLAQLLEHDAHWAPAADVYATAVELIAPRPRDHDLLPMCYDRQGYCLRQTGQHDGVANLYNEGIAASLDLEAKATNEDDKQAATGWALRLRISNAVFEMESGNLPDAEYELDVIVDDAKKAAIPDLIARALHERGQVAYERDQDDQAAMYFYQAAELHTDTRLARRAELDLAVALADLGFIEYAHVVCEIVRNRPETAGVDWKALAGINLMRLAHMRGDQPDFDRLREQLSAEKMSGRLRAYYHLTAGQALQRFGRVRESRVEYQRAIEVAQAFRVNRLVMKAEQLLKMTEPEVQKPRRSPRESTLVTPILAAIDARRGPFAGAAT